MTLSPDALPPALVAALESAAQTAHPGEACGLLTGAVEGLVIQDLCFHPSRNVTELDPRLTFEIDPALHIKLARAARSEGPDLVGVWHSHPNGPAVPSETDKARAQMVPGWLWVITGRAGHFWETKAYWL